MCSEPKLPLLAVVGCTAGGKSRLAVRLAQELNGEVVSCDSMQIYRSMDIGTAKPTPEEMEGIPHHLIDFADPREVFSCADYVGEAKRVIRDICARGRFPILCGGTGLYLDRLLFGGGDAEEAEPDPAIREKWQAYRDENGNHALHERLREVDAESAEAIHENNVHRVIRALEIFRTSGISKSEWDRQTPSEAYRPDAMLYYLNAPREQLYERIDRRVDVMMEMGLYDEVRSLQLIPDSTAAQAIGYKEMLGCLRGEQTLAEAADAIRLASRRYAKRQLTWFRHQKGFTELDVSQFANFEDIVNFVAEAFEQSKNMV